MVLCPICVCPKTKLHFQDLYSRSSLGAQQVKDLAVVTVVVQVTLVVWVPPLAWELPHAVGMAKKKKIVFQCQFFQFSAGILPYRIAFAS